MSIERALKRPRDYGLLGESDRYDIDQRLGLLDWKPSPAEYNEYVQRMYGTWKGPAEFGDEATTAKLERRVVTLESVVVQLRSELVRVQGLVGRTQTDALDAYSEARLALARLEAYKDTVAEAFANEHEWKLGDAYRKKHG